MESFIKYTDGVRFRAESRGHQLFTDQPVEDGGSDGGMTPPELMLAALGACVGHYAVLYLKFHNLPGEGLTVRVAAEKDKHPARISEFRVFLEHPAAAEEKHREGLRRAAQKCLIHATLLNEPSVHFEVAPCPAPALTS